MYKDFGNCYVNVKKTILFSVRTDATVARLHRKALADLAQRFAK